MPGIMLAKRTTNSQFLPRPPIGNQLKILTGGLDWLA
jgi:hypothetical protein